MYKFIQEVRLLCVSCQYILALVMFVVDNQKKFQTNLSLHGLDARDLNQLYFSVANLLCFHRGVSYSAVEILNSLPNNIKNLRNDGAV